MAKAGVPVGQASVVVPHCVNDSMVRVETQAETSTRLRQPMSCRLLNSSYFHCALLIFLIERHSWTLVSIYAPRSTRLPVRRTSSGLQR